MTKEKAYRERPMTGQIIVYTQRSRPLELYDETNLTSSIQQHEQKTTKTNNNQKHVSFSVVR